MSSFSILDYTASTVTISVSGLTVGNTVRFFVRLASDTSNTTIDSQYTATSTTMTKTFSGLSANTTYAANVHDGSSWLGACTFTTPSSGIDLWDWNASNGTATAAQTQTAYNAVANKGYVSDFSYLVWNDLCSKANEAALIAGAGWLTNYGTLADTKMTASDKTMTASRFNALRFNIGSRVSTGISEVSTGDTVLGSYFITLASKLNVWISSL